MPQYITIPTSLTAPADGSKVDLSTACEWHRDDSALPNTLAVENGTYRVFLLSDPTTETAALPAVNPVLSSATFTPGGGGTPPSLEFVGTYSGSVSLVAAMAFGRSSLSFAVNASQLAAQSGGTGVVAFADTPVPVIGGVFSLMVTLTEADLAVVTSLGDMALVDRVALNVRESTAAGVSSIITTTITAGQLDAVPPAFASATTNAAGTSITITTNPDEDLFGTPVLAQAAVTVNGTARTVSSIAIAAGKLTLTLATAVAFGQTVTVSYSNATGALVDALGNPLAAFSAQAVTNAVPEAVPMQMVLGPLGLYSVSSVNPRVFTADLSSLIAGDRLIVVYGNNNGMGNMPDPITVGGVSIMPHLAIAGSPTQSNRGLVIYEYVMPAAGSANTPISITLASASNGHGLFLMGVRNGRFAGAIGTPGGALVLSAAITPGNADNFIVACALKSGNLVGFTNATAIPLADAQIKLGIVEDAPAGVSRTITLETDTTANGVLALIRVEPL